MAQILRHINKWITAKFNGVLSFEKPALDVFTPPCKFTIC